MEILCGTTDLIAVETDRAAGLPQEPQGGQDLLQGLQEEIARQPRHGRQLLFGVLREVAQEDTSSELNECKRTWCPVWGRKRHLIFK